MRRYRKEIDGRQTRVAIFDDIEDLISSVDSEETSSARASANLNRGDFTGRKFGTLKELYVTVRSPWAEGIEIVERMQNEIEAEIPKPTTRRRRHSYSEDCGDDICVDRMRNSDPFWRSMKPASVTGSQRLSVVTSISTAWNVCHDDILWRGAVAVVLCDLLEEAGFSVTCLLGSRTSRSIEFTNDDCLWFLTTKRSDCPVNKGVLAATISGWFYRTLGFAGTVFAGRGQWRAGIGSPCPVAGLGEITQDENVIVIENVWSFDAAVAKVKEEIAKLGTT